MIFILSTAYNIEKEEILMNLLGVLIFAIQMLIIFYLYFLIIILKDELANMKTKQHSLEEKLNGKEKNNGTYN